MSRRGLFEFLKIAAKVSSPASNANVERWLSLYRCDQYARARARWYGVRIPRAWGKREKARVRLDLGNLTPLDTEFPEQRQLIRRVREWTRT